MMSLYLPYDWIILAFLLWFTTIDLEMFLVTGIALGIPAVFRAGFLSSEVRFSNSYMLSGIFTPWTVSSVVVLN